MHGVYLHTYKIENHFRNENCSRVWWRQLNRYHIIVKLNYCNKFSSSSLSLPLFAQNCFVLFFSYSLTHKLHAVRDKTIFIENVGNMKLELGKLIQKVLIMYACKEMFGNLCNMLTLFVYFFLFLF
jgi:hypothetical protein